jgi:secretion/DNA translocation related TadE-like protein
VTRRLAGDQRGSATVLAVVVSGVLATTFVVAAVIGGALVGQRRAATAADLAALAGASALQQAQPACTVARRLARANDATLTSCTVDGDEVRVGTAVRVPLWRGRSLTVESAARAGPEVLEGISGA